MDIRIINRDGELINVSRLSIKTIGRNLIGIDEKKNVVNIEVYGSEEESKEELRKIVSIIWGKHDDCDKSAVIIDLNKEEERGERGERDGESK